MEFNDDYPQYEMMAHHSEEEGKKKRKKLWNVFWIMLCVTIVELIIGFCARDWHLLDDTLHSTIKLKTIFIVLTLAKAGYIVLAFMHLGDELKAMRMAILVPYITFILYLAVMASIGEGGYAGVDIHKNRMDKLLIDQQAKVRSGDSHHGGGEEPAGEHHE